MTRPLTIVAFVHSILSCWNHGNAHFLRGVLSELAARGHRIRVYEPADGWSRANLVADHGEAPLREAAALWPDLVPRTYDPATLDPAEALDGADLALVHEWNDPGLVARLGRRRKGGHPCRLLFHDTHHRAVTAPQELARTDLSSFDGVLAFGEALATVYRTRGWGRRVHVWHEAADTRLFRPLPREKTGDLVWIGNWGDGERTEELRRFLIRPARRLRLRARVQGVRWPEEARMELAASGIGFDGWLPNHRAPEVLARHRVTVHVPRRPYAAALPGIPTIRVFEALACGIPLVSAPWDDAEGLFRPGRDFLFAHDEDEMARRLSDVLSDPGLAASLARDGRARILDRHTCAHRADELLAIAAEIGLDAATPVIADGRAP